MEKYTYLFLNILTVAFPLAASWDRRFRFASKWKALFPAILITSIPFLTWDAWFTEKEIWGFNGEYLTGLSIGNLPLEEILFFITVPFACIFIYETVLFYTKPVKNSRTWFALTRAAGLFLLGMALVNADKLYTLICFTSGGLMLIVHSFLKKSWLPQFLISYCWTIIPFLVVNGVLTALPVVWYNNSENLGRRIWSIPVEDTVYSLSLLLLTCTLYELFRRKLISPAITDPIFSKKRGKSAAREV